MGRWSVGRWGEAGLGLGGERTRIRVMQMQRGRNSERWWNELEKVRGGARVVEKESRLLLSDLRATKLPCRGRAHRASRESSASLQASGAPSTRASNAPLRATSSKNLESYPVGAQPRTTTPSYQRSTLSAAFCSTHAGRSGQRGHRRRGGRRRARSRVGCAGLREVA